ncbi:MAG TPA: HEAT repeat domain-containing protein [Planctomycetaceae bacterium]|nr:HEAT repeat domain-containing protein [Planctomycetaceae bacterium]
MLVKFTVLMLWTDTMKTSRQFTNCVVFLAALFAIASTTWAADDESPDRERDLLAVLRSDAAASEKAITCKLLAIHGSSDAVPDLEKLLSNPQLSSWARIALEAIPGDASDAALRRASESLEGRLLVGMINSLGVRRDANSVQLLTTRMQDKDAAVASAAAVALGRIANTAATKSLRSALAGAPVDVRSAVAEGCVLCAEQLYNEGNLTEAIAIYDQVRKADVPKQRMVEATRGAILARNQDGIPLLLELFQSPDKILFRLALTTVREIPGGQVDKALASEMDRATPERAALIVRAMADRPETVQLAAVLAAAERGPKQVRIAAIDALSRVGDASCLATLLTIAIDSDADLAALAKATLTDLPVEKIDTQIVAMLSKAEGKIYPLLIELVGQRRIDAVPILLKALDDSDKVVRRAALSALGETISATELPVLVAQVVTPTHPEDAPAAQQALKTASVRMPDREACAAKLAAAIKRSESVSTKGTLLEILGAVGGTEALTAMSNAAKSDDLNLQDVSTRLLGTWMTEDAAPVLLDLAKTMPNKKYQVRALRGYIRIARQFVLPAQQRATMCQNALDAAQQVAEKRLVIDVLKRYPHAATLKVAFNALEVAEVKDEAAEAILMIAQKIKGKGVELILSKSVLAEVKLEIVKAEYGAGSTQLDVTSIVRKHAGNLRLITLPATNYNNSFGRDPSPGSVKKLKIQYRINGKPGTASFGENALILLPLPK